MKSKLLFIAFFLFGCTLFVNAQTKDPVEEKEAYAATVDPDIVSGVPTGGKVVKTDKQLSTSNKKVASTKNKTTVPAQRKKIAKVNATKVSSSK